MITIHDKIPSISVKASEELPHDKKAQEFSKQQPPRSEGRI